MQKHHRTLIQLAASATIALLMAVAFLVVGGLSPTQAKGGHNGDGNHGSTVSSVARSTCTATNPHNPTVSNHGMCVSSVARAGRTETESETATHTSHSGTAGTTTSGTKGSKHGSKHHHHKHSGKHGSKSGKK